MRRDSGPGFHMVFLLCEHGDPYPLGESVDQRNSQTLLCFLNPDNLESDNQVY